MQFLETTECTWEHSVNLWGIVGSEGWWCPTDKHCQWALFRWNSVRSFGEIWCQRAVRIVGFAHHQRGMSRSHAYAQSGSPYCASRHQSWECTLEQQKVQALRFWLCKHKRSWIQCINVLGTYWWSIWRLWEIHYTDVSPTRNDRQILTLECQYKSRYLGKSFCILTHKHRWLDVLPIHSATLSIHSRRPNDLPFVTHSSSYHQILMSLKRWKIW